MTVPQSEATYDANILQTPLYTAFDAARYLHVPAWALLGDHRAFVFPEVHGFHTQLIGLLAGDLWWDEESREPRLSFQELGSLFLHSVALFTSHDLRKYWHPDMLWKLAVTFRRASSMFAAEPIDTSEPDRLLASINSIDLWNRAGVGLMRKYALMYLSRVEVRNGAITKLYPFSRDPSIEAPRHVVIDPEVRFGRPTVKGAPTDVLLERWRAGDTTAELADDYGLTNEEVDEAIRYGTLARRGCTCLACE